MKQEWSLKRNILNNSPNFFFLSFRTNQTSCYTSMLQTFNRYVLSNWVSQMCTGSVDNIIDLIGFEDKAKEIVDTLFSISFPF